MPRVLASGGNGFLGARGVCVPRNEGYAVRCRPLPASRTDRPEGLADERVEEGGFIPGAAAGDGTGAPVCSVDVNLIAPASPAPPNPSPSLAIPSPFVYYESHVPRKENSE
jgi:hypothetical protein